MIVERERERDSVCVCVRVFVWEASKHIERPEKRVRWENPLLH